MKATLWVEGRAYPMVQIEDAEMDKLRADPKTKELCGFPVWFDSQERIWPHVTPDREDIYVVFS